MSSLWKNPNFLKLWSAQTASAIGSKVSFLAVPLTAVIFLEATPAQMGYLSAIGALPGLLLGLLTGVLADRGERRRLLILADLGRGLLLLTIPLAAWFGWLHIAVLGATLFCTGTLNLLFGAAHHAYLPTLVRKEQLVDANSKMEISRSAAEIAGPALAGWLIQIVGAPITILVDAVSYFISALFLTRIEATETAPEQADKDEPLIRQLLAGGRLLLENRTLLTITMATATITFFNAALEAVYLIYMARNLDLSPRWIGLIFGTGSVGFLFGALLANRLTKSLGLGPMLILGLLFLALSDLVLPLASGPIWVIVVLLILGQIGFGLGLTIYQVGQVSLRQSITPDHLLGRMSATLSFAVAALIPLGAVLGGLAGEWIGLRPTLVLAAGGELMAVIWLLFSPVRALRE